MSGFQPLGLWWAMTQPVALGWDMAAPLALSKVGADDVQQREMTVDCARNAPNVAKDIESNRRTSLDKER